MRGYTIRRTLFFLLLLGDSLLIEANPTATITPKVGKVSPGILASISLKAQVAKIKALRHLGQRTDHVIREFVSKNKEYLSVDDIISLTRYFQYDERFCYQTTGDACSETGAKCLGHYDVKEKLYLFSVVDHLSTQRLWELQPNHLWSLITEQTSPWFYTNVSPVDKKNSTWALHLLETYPDEITQYNVPFLFRYLSESEKQAYILNTFKKYAKKLNPYLIREYLKALPLSDKDYWIEHFIKNDYARISGFVTDYLPMLSPAKKEACALHILKLHHKTIRYYDLEQLLPLLCEKEQHYWSAFLLDQYFHEFVTSRHNSNNYFKNRYEGSYELKILVKHLPNKDAWCLKTLENHFDRLPIVWSEILSEQLSGDNKSLWQKKVLIKKFDPIFSYLSHRAVPGPLFSDYFVKYSLQSIVNPNHPHFTALLPRIFDYVTTEYNNKRIVFFHGQQSQWNFLERLFRELYQLTEKTQTPEDFIWLRYKKIPGLSDTQVTDHFKTFSYNNRPHLLFANLHLFANHQGSNSWDYITNNSDQTTNKNYNNVAHRLAPLFEELGFTKEYEQVKKECSDLYILHKDAISELGNHGTLLVISMPESTARAVSYSASSGGPERKIKINNVETSNVVTIAHNFEQAPFDNEYCIILGPDMCTPERATKAGIRMKRFNPVITGKTKKYQKFEEELGKLMAKVKRLYEARMAGTKTV